MLLVLIGILGINLGGLIIWIIINNKINKKIKILNQELMVLNRILDLNEKNEEGLTEHEQNIERLKYLRKKENVLEILSTLKRLKEDIFPTKLFN